MTQKIKTLNITSVKMMEDSAHKERDQKLNAAADELLERFGAKGVVIFAFFEDAQQEISATKLEGYAKFAVNWAGEFRNGPGPEFSVRMAIDALDARAAAGVDFGELTGPKQ